MLYIYMNRMGQAPLCYHNSSDSDSLISYFINFSWDWCHDRIWTNCTNNCKIRSKLSFSINFFYIILYHSICFHRYLKIFEKFSYQLASSLQTSLRYNHIHLLLAFLESRAWILSCALWNLFFQIFKNKFTRPKYRSDFKYMWTRRSLKISNFKSISLIIL